MTYQETEIISQAIFLAYPNQSNKLDKTKFIGLWHKQLHDFTFRSVSVAIKQWIGSKKFMPQISEIKELVNPWYDHFPQKGVIEYNDKDVAWATWEDFNSVPKELAKRMIYVPDPNDQERNNILKECEELRDQLKMKQGGN